MVAAMTDGEQQIGLTLSYVLIGFQGRGDRGRRVSDIGAGTRGRGPKFGVTVVVGWVTPACVRAAKAPRSPPARSPSKLSGLLDYDRPAAGRFWCARRPTPRDLRPGLSIQKNPGRRQSRQLADDANCRWPRLVHARAYKFEFNLNRRSSG